MKFRREIDRNIQSKIGKGANRSIPVGSVEFSSNFRGRSCPEVACFEGCSQGTNHSCMERLSALPEYKEQAGALNSFRRLKFSR